MRSGLFESGKSSFGRTFMAIEVKSFCQFLNKELINRSFIFLTGGHRLYVTYAWAARCCAIYEPELVDNAAAETVHVG